MRNITYTIASKPMILSHYSLPTRLVRDATMMTDDHIDANARVRSGDYFATLATQLDHLADSLQSTAPASAYQLEQIVRELLYVQANYSVVKRQDS